MTIGGETRLTDRFGNAIARRPTHGRRVSFARGSRAAPKLPCGRGPGQGFVSLSFVDSTGGPLTRRAITVRS